MTEPPEVVYPGAALWPENAPAWATYAKTFRVDGNERMLDLLFTREWVTPAPQEHLEDEAQEPLVHFRLVEGWTRPNEDARWFPTPPALQFGEDPPFSDQPREAAAMLREIADILDGTWSR